MITNAPRGTKDWYGADMHQREIIEGICKEAARKFNIKQIMTPVFEHTDLFLRGVGETTDVVQKEMYTFEDKGGRSISLKPEGTAGAIRAYLEHSMYADGGLTKLFYITPAFRYEKPQSGRLRQHHQFGVEYVGAESPYVEAELISLILTICKELEISGVSVHINSIGCKECRPRYNEALLEYLHKNEGSLCKTCKERMEKNPLRVLDCKEEGCKEIVKNAPRTIDFLCESCKTHFEQLQGILSSMGIPFTVDTGIVRGLDYYTKTVFEIVNEEGFTLSGGGRYDGLVHEIDGKKDIPAAGFGMGLERLLDFTRELGGGLPTEAPPDIYIGAFPETMAEAYKIVAGLREKGIAAETDYLGRSVKAQMKYANKIHAPQCVIIGADEVASGKVKLKNMETGTEEECLIGEIGEKICQN